MIFASDLDQTLIYSLKAFRLLPGKPMVAVTLIESYDGRQISFMADEAIVKLQAIASKNCFVPVTTRTIEQYKRISLFHDKILPTYSVVSNGGNILKNGLIDGAWQKQIGSDMKQLCLSPEDMLIGFNEIHHEEWASEIRMADELFYYCVVERDKVPQQEIADFTMWAEGQNWKVSLQGRKLYVVPQVVNKWAAVAHIRDLLQEKIVVAAGDSLLDLCMLEQADYAIAPCHGELWDSYSRSTLPRQNMNFTKQVGILASNDILDYINECNVVGTVGKSI